MSLRKKLWEQVLHCRKQDKIEYISVTVALLFARSGKLKVRQFYFV